MIEHDEWVSPRKRVAEVRAQHITLAEYAKTWIEERNVKPRTRIGYESLWDNNIQPTLGKVALVHLTPESIRTWFAGLGSEHVRRNSHAYGLLHAILATAVTDQLITANPATGAGHEPADQTQPVILDVAEVAALADAFKPERLRALVLVLAWCGVRWGEAIELKRADVAVDAKAIRVGRAVTHRDGCRVDTPKSGKGRSVIVPPHIRRRAARTPGRARRGRPWRAVVSGCTRMPPERQRISRLSRTCAENHWQRRPSHPRSAPLRRHDGCQGRESARDDGQAGPLDGQGIADLPGHRQRS